MRRNSHCLYHTFLLLLPLLQIRCQLPPSARTLHYFDESTHTPYPSATVLTLALALALPGFHRQDPGENGRRMRGSGCLGLCRQAPAALTDKFDDKGKADEKVHVRNNSFEDSAKIVEGASGKKIPLDEEVITKFANNSLTKHLY